MPDFSMVMTGGRLMYNLTKAMSSKMKKVRVLFERTRSLITRQKKIRYYLQNYQVRKLQIGCGGISLKGWLNTDLCPAEEQLFVDAREKLPFEDCTFDYIFSEHLLEHLEHREGVCFLRECFRIIKTGGTIRIATPDLRFLVDLYNSDKNEIQEQYISWAVKSFLPDVSVCQDTYVINNFFHNWGHKFIYDFKILEDTMNKAGFINIKCCKVGESENPELRGIESHHLFIPAVFNELETMVVEGIKPDCG